jgi:hypothetical protein
LLFAKEQHGFPLSRKRFTTAKLVNDGVEIMKGGLDAPSKLRQMLINP